MLYAMVLWFICASAFTVDELEIDNKIVIASDTLWFGFKSCSQAFDVLLKMAIMRIFFSCRHMSTWPF